MSKEITLIIVGVIVLLAPFSGLPSFWRTVLLVVCGLSIISIGVLKKAQTRNIPSVPPSTDAHATEEN